MSFFIIEFLLRKNKIFFELDRKNLNFLVLVEGAIISFLSFLHKQKLLQKEAN